MKIAICFSGLLRDLDEIDYWNSIIKKHKMDVYGSFWEVDRESKLTFEKLNPINVEYENYNAFKESTIETFNKELFVPLWPEKNLGLDIKALDYILKNNVLSMWYKIWRANLMSKSQKYDIVIRTRNDIFFNELEIEKNEYLNIPWGYCSVKSWNNCGGRNDMFAYGSPENMDYYSSLFLYLTRYLKDGEYYFPAENLLSTHLNQRDLMIRLLPIHLFLSRDKQNSFNKAYGINEYEFNKSKGIKGPPDPYFSFYKK